MKSRLIITLSLYFILNCFFIVIIALSNFEKQTYNRKKGNQSTPKVWENLNSLVHFEKDLKNATSEIKLLVFTMHNFDGGTRISIPVKEFFKSDNITITTPHKDLISKISETIINKYKYLKLNIVIGKGIFAPDHVLEIENQLAKYNEKLEYSILQKGIEDQEVHIIVGDR